MLAKPFDWDACQMPINVMDASYLSFQKDVVPACLAKGTGVIGMKGLGGYGAAIVKEGGIPAATAYRYALSQPVATQVSGMSSLDELRANVGVARSFVPMSAAEQADLVARWRRAQRCAGTLRALQVHDRVRRAAPQAPARRGRVIFSLLR